MPLLEDEKTKFFEFLDNLLKKGKLENDLNLKGGVVMSDDKRFEEMAAEIKKLSDDRDAENKEMVAKIKELSDAREAEKKSLEDSFNANLDSVKKELEEKHKSEIEDANKRLEDTEKKLSERDTSLHSERVEKSASELVAKGIWPAVVAKAKKVMLADTGDNFVKIKLEDKEDASEISLSEVICDILDTIPSDVRIDLSEVSRTDKADKGNTKYMSDDEVAEYAKKKDISYEDACAELSEQGKIEFI